MNTAKGMADGKFAHAFRWLPLPAQRGQCRPALGDRNETGELGGDEEGPALAVDEKQRIASGLAERALELRDVADGLMVDFLDQVALLQAGVGHLAGRVDVGDNDALGCRGNAQLLGNACIEVGDFDAFQRFAAAFLVIRFDFGGFGWHFGELDGFVALRAVAQDLELELGAWLHHRNAHAELIAVCNGLAVDLENDVAALNACLLRGAIGGNVADNDPLRVFLAERFGHRRSYILRVDTQIGAGNMSSSSGPGP